MARLTKSGLKAILKETLKECIREILVEEPQIFENQLKMASNIQKTNPAAPTRKVENPRQVAQDLVAKSFADENNSFGLENSMLAENINSIAASFGIGGDSSQQDLMKEIFTDTAVTTLQQQHEIGMTGGTIPMNLPATEEQAKEDEESLKKLSVCGDMSRWAKVAFAK